jgi:flagellar export protein FliJ
MRKFKFRLQGLENIKEMELDSLRQEYAQQQNELRRREQELLNARDNLNSTYTEFIRHKLNNTDPAMLLSLESYTLVLRDQLSACQTGVARQRQELANARERLTSKHKEKKVLEKFHERQFTKYSQYVDRELQKELDETASNAFQQHQM